MTRFDAPLPLPGEQPATIWRPRRRRTRPRSRVPWSTIITGLVVVGLGMAVWAWLAGGTPVTVIVNGAPVRLRTHSPDISGAVQAAGVGPTDVAFADPPLDSPLKPGDSIQLLERLPVIVHADGQTRQVTSTSASPADIVRQAGLTVGPADSIRLDRVLIFSPAAIKADPALASAPSLPREITVVRARTVVVSQGGSPVAFQTSASTLGEALIAAGYTLYEGDLVNPPPDTLIPPEGLQVSITPAIPVIVQADGRDQATRTRQSTVGGLLAELGLTPDGGDYAIPGLQTPVTPGLTVHLVRSQQQEQDERLPIAFTTTFVPDPDMELDQQREVQPGEPGVMVRRSIVQLEDGVEVSRAVVDQWVESQPQPRVVAYGVKIVIRELKTAEGTLKYWRKLRVLATSYSPSNASDKKPGDPRYGLSGTGAPVRRGVVAVDTRVISLGTHLYVPDYGEGVALDVGGAVKGLRVDLGYEDPLPRLWNDWTDLYLLLPVPPPDQIIWVIPNFTPQ